MMFPAEGGALVASHQNGFLGGASRIADHPRDDEGIAREEEGEEVEPCH